MSIHFLSILTMICLTFRPNSRIHSLLQGRFWPWSCVLYSYRGRWWCILGQAQEAAAAENRWMFVWNVTWKRSLKKKKKKKSVFGIKSVHIILKLSTTTTTTELGRKAHKLKVVNECLHLSPSVQMDLISIFDFVSKVGEKIRGRSEVPE